MGQLDIYSAKTEHFVLDFAMSIVMLENADVCAQRNSD
jgi:hypothetical protein